MKVARLSVTPVKGLALDHPDSVRLDASGAVGDREFLLADERGRLVSITRSGALLDLRAACDGRTLTIGDRSGAVEPGEPVTVDLGHRELAGRAVPGPWDALLTERLGRPVRLVRADAPGDGSDVRPVTLLGGASVAELARHAGAAIDPRRFRMTIDLETDAPHVEDTWAGRRLRGDEVELEVLGPVPRCAAITRHPDHGDRDLPLVHAIKAYRGLAETELGPGKVAFGVYARVVTPGTLRRGEALRL